MYLVLTSSFMDLRIYHVDLLKIASDVFSTGCSLYSIPLNIWKGNLHYLVNECRVVLIREALLD